MSSMPETVNQYFALDARRDHDAILALFADDAVVIDEGETMTGRDAIRSWREGFPRLQPQPVSSSMATKDG